MDGNEVLRTYPETNGGRLLRRGDTFDPEDYRTTYRLQHARGILRVIGIDPTVAHSDNERVDFGIPPHGCDSRCVTSWPEWATGDMFDRAYALANIAQTARGLHNRRQS